MNNIFRKELTIVCLLVLLTFPFSFGKVKNPNKTFVMGTYNEKYETNKDSIISELKKNLNEELSLFYPLSIDTPDGGYYSDINYKWQLEGRQEKMIVTQARHVWSTANAAMYFHNSRSKGLIKIAAHGFKFLKDKMWDKKYGGFYNLVNRQGEPIKENGKIIKQVYGNAFAIYGLAAYYKASGDTSALNLAKETFEWIDKHSYDPKYGGYFQFMKRNGTPFKNGFYNTPPKDQNSAIHILECFTELYGVWHNDLVKERLNALLLLIRDKMIKNEDYLQLFFNRDLTPVSYRDSSEASRKKNFELDHISFGHNVETAYLMLEASNTLGIKDNSATIKVGKSMDDFALANGWDSTNGGIYDGGYNYKGTNNVVILLKTKEWWSQIEALNSFLLMAQLFPNDKENYYDKFCIQWNYVKQYLIDHKYGGFYWDSFDTAPNVKKNPKATIWKADYHTTRGMINCIRRLEELK